MPAELLEKPVEVVEKSQEILLAVSQAANQDVAKQPKSLLHKIFEGHEEFLGCTPD